MSGPSVWEKWMSDEMHPGGRRLTRLMLDKASLCPGAAVADIGCGTGAGVAFLRAQGFDASGVDCSAVLLEHARARYGVPVFQAEALSLPFAQDAMDALLFECSLASQADCAGVLEECARVLRPGGKLMVSDIFDRTENEPQKDWEGMLQTAGFSMLCWEDCSDVMAGFVARAVWELGDITPLKNICTKANPACRPGYFIMVAVYVPPGRKELT